MAASGSEMRPLSIAGALSPIEKLGPASTTGGRLKVSSQVSFTYTAVPDWPPKKRIPPSPGEYAAEVSERAPGLLAGVHEVHTLVAGLKLNNPPTWVLVCPP